MCSLFFQRNERKYKGEEEERHQQKQQGHQSVLNTFTRKCLNFALLVHVHLDLLLFGYTRDALGFSIFDQLTYVRQWILVKQTRC